MTENTFLWPSCRNHILAAGAVLTHYPQNVVEAVPLFSEIYHWKISLMSKGIFLLVCPLVVCWAEWLQDFSLYLEYNGKARHDEESLFYILWSSVGFWIKVKDFFNSRKLSLLFIWSPLPLCPMRSPPPGFLFNLLDLTYMPLMWVPEFGWLVFLTAFYIVQLASQYGHHIFTSGHYCFT